MLVFANSINVILQLPTHWSDIRFLWWLLSIFLNCQLLNYLYCINASLAFAGTVSYLFGIARVQIAGGMFLLAKLSLAIISLPFPS